MHETTGKLRIEKLLKKLSDYDVIFELEATSLIQKFKLMRDTFILPLEISRTCTFIEKIYVGFSVLEIRDLSGKVIGIKFQNSRGEIYQITLLEKNQTISTEYRISCKDFDSIIEVEEIKGLLPCDLKQYSTFEFIHNKSSHPFLNSKEDILHRMDLMIEENDRETVKIYTIRRKGFQ